MAKNNKGIRSDVVIRLGDTIAFTGLRTYKVADIDRTNNTATLRKVDDDTLTTFDLAWLTDSVATFTNGIHAYMGHPVVWLPVPAGLDWYGFGYAKPVLGGYAYSDSCDTKFDGKKVIRDDNGNPIPLKDHNPAKYDLYMSDPAKYWRFSGKK